MNSRPTSAACAIAALAIFTVWITWRAKTLEIANNKPPTPAIVGQPAPDFQLTSLDSRIVSLADFRGRKKVVISFWASWCGPCRVEMPELRKFYQQTHKDDANYELLAISVDDERAPAEAAAKEDKLPFPVLMDSSGKTSKAYHVDAIPTLLLIDEQGKVAWGQTGVEQTTVFMLAQSLGIKNYIPQPEGKTDAGSY